MFAFCYILLFQYYYFLFIDVVCWMYSISGNFSISTFELLKLFSIIRRLIALKVKNVVNFLNVCFGILYRTVRFHFTYSRFF